ncbi:MAG: hypothetical protein Q7R88_01485, partial [bacterium]|nr:hypothetical protein [bacterium]
GFGFVKRTHWVGVTSWLATAILLFSMANLGITQKFMAIAIILATPVTFVCVISGVLYVIFQRFFSGRFFHYIYSTLLLVFVLISIIVSGLSANNLLQKASLSLENQDIETTTADWKTYHDVHAVSAFEFRAPRELNMGKVGPGGGVAYDANNHAFLFIVSCGYPNESVVGDGLISVDGFPAFIVEEDLKHTVGYSYQYLAKVFTTPKGTCDISLLINSSLDRAVMRKMFESVLSTFKFTK